MQPLQLVRAAHLVQGEGIAAAGPLRHEQDHLLLRVVELQLLEQDEVNGRESVAQPAADGFGIAHGQQLRGEDHRDAAVRFQKRARVNEQRRPGRREAGEPDTLRERCGRGQPSGFALVLVVADKRRIADDRVHPRKLAAELGRWRLREEVPGMQAGIEALVVQQRARVPQRCVVKVDPVEQATRGVRVRSVDHQSSRGCEQEGGLATCRIEHVCVGSSPRSPCGQEIRDRGRREERAALLAKLGGVVAEERGLHESGEATGGRGHKPGAPWVIERGAPYPVEPWSTRHTSATSRSSPTSIMGSRRWPIASSR